MLMQEHTKIKECLMMFWSCADLSTILLVSQWLAAYGLILGERASWRRISLTHCRWVMLPSRD